MKYLRSIREAIKFILWNIEYTAYELFNGVVMLALGTSLLLGMFVDRIEVLSDGTISPPFIFFIAMFMILFGIGKVYAISRHKIAMRKWLALVGTFLWGFLFVAFNQSPVTPVSILFITIFILFSMWCYIRLFLKHKGKRLLDPTDSFKNT